MMFPGLFAPPTTEFASVHYRPTPAVYGRASAAAGPWPLRQVGTGGIANAQFIQGSFGYQAFAILESVQLVDEAPFAKLMQQVKTGFGRTMSRLPEVFGVSRQTLYNWLDGETPKPAQQARLQQLAEAAEVFTQLGVKPTSAMLDRTVTRGKSLLQLIAEGEDGKESAKKLVRIVQRSSESRAKLDALLGDRKAKLTADDIGAPAFNEDV
jgi:transcriptional regulator with XRE-family HTH domain